MAQICCYKLEAALHGQSLKCNLTDLLSRELGQSQRDSPCVRVHAQKRCLSAPIILSADTATDEETKL